MAEQPEPGKPTEAELRELCRKVEAGDASALPALRRVMDVSPEMVDIFGSVAGNLVESLLRIYGNNLPAKEAVRRKVMAVQAELAGPNPTPLERLLAERSAVCWLQAYRYETVYEQASDLTIRQADYHQRRIDAAHRRFLSTVRTLAQVRKLGLPAIQVNIAKKQVNVAGG